MKGSRLSTSQVFGALSRVNGSKCAPHFVGWTRIGGGHMQPLMTQLLKIYIYPFRNCLSNLFLPISQAQLLSSQMQQSSVDGDPADELTSLRFTIIATWATALVAVYLRFLARRLSKAGLWYDDWLMIPATVSHPSRDDIVESTTPLVQEDDSSSHIYQLVATVLCFNLATWSMSSQLHKISWDSLEYAYRYPLLNSGR